METCRPNLDESDRPTWRTRFKMWGSESSEAWHVFAFSKGDEATGEPAWVIAEECIDTPSKELSGATDQIVLDETGHPLKPVNNDICDPVPDYEMER